MTEKIYRKPNIKNDKDIFFGQAYDQKSIAKNIHGLVEEEEIKQIAQEFSARNSDEYIESALNDPAMVSAPDIVQQLGKTEKLCDYGSLYIGLLKLPDNKGQFRRIGVIAQNRRHNNGAWSPEQHREATRHICEFSRHLYPIVNFVDTPGAEASEGANKNNQAHSISALIAEAMHARVPVISILYGLGYSGGAIPLFCGNLLLAVRNSVFSTIQPQGLSSIAKKLNLSWQQCAQIVGISCWQLYQQKLVDAIIDYDPAKAEQNISHLSTSINSALDYLDHNAQHTIAEDKKFPLEFAKYAEDYSQNLPKALPPATHSTLADHSAFNLPIPTTYYWRQQRYYHLLKRLQVTQISSFGLLSDEHIAEGELLTRIRLESEKNFYSWLQNTPQIIYDDNLTRLWKKFLTAKEQRQQERNRFTAILFGQPEENYRKAIKKLSEALMRSLYNSWKSNAANNLENLIYWLQKPNRLDILYQVGDIPADLKGLVKKLKTHKPLFELACRSFSHEGKKFLLEDAIERRTEIYSRNQICLELNLLLNHPNLYSTLKSPEKPNHRTTDIIVVEHEALRNNKILLDQVLGIKSLQQARPIATEKKLDELVLIDLLSLPDLQPSLLSENLNLVVFNKLYNNLVNNMLGISGRTKNRWQLDFDKTTKLYGELCAKIVHSLEKKYEIPRNQMQDDFNAWVLQLGESSESVNFLAKIDEWKRHEFPRASETFFAVISHIFYSSFPSMLRALYRSGQFDGRIMPLKIGQRKDFWNQLSLAYRDLAIDQLLLGYKKSQAIATKDFINLFCRNFSEQDGDLISADPCSFPGFRKSIDVSIKAKKTPCGLITGVANLKGKKVQRVGLILSNPSFQAGSFDMASCTKFIRLLDHCEQNNWPVIMFISSGGMQTKEGAGALYSMALTNQRLTDFITRTGLPVIAFGYGDCTGGAQASFVTHPLVYTCYFSGTYIPFAGRIVVPEHLPLHSILSNYLNEVPGSMDYLVKHPLYSELDQNLHDIDPNIIIPLTTVTEVIDSILRGKSLRTDKLTKSKTDTTANKNHNQVILRPVKKLLVHARGCTAAKLIKIAQQEKIPVVLVQSDPDLNSAVADQLNCPPDTLVGIGGNTPDQSYLNGRSIIEVALQNQVDALHPGIGFLSENPSFARMCIEKDINFIGPSPASMDLMGNKSNAISTAIKCETSVVPGSYGIVEDVEQAKAIGKRIGYPIILKAVHGGGGRGIEVVYSAEDMYQSFFRVTGEARSAFGSGDIYIEKYIESLRHIEVQILRDSRGTTKILGLRDCSVQRQRQKIIEESGSTLLSQRLKRKAYASAKALAEGVDYIGAGTVEFIHDLENNDIYFMEMNTRLQVEHPVTEKTADIDIVAEQLKIAAGDSIARLKRQENGYAIEARINAEKPVWDEKNKCLKFYPNPGKVTRLVLPESRNIELICSVAEGKTISPYYDSMIIQVIAHGQKRNSTVKALHRYLSSIKIEGVATNIPLLCRILSDKVFLSGEYDTRYLEDLFERINIKSFLGDYQTQAQSQKSLAKTILIQGSTSVKVLAPSTGVCYLTPSPNEAEYVSENQCFSSSNVLCQIEAMKIFAPVSLDQINAQTQAELYSTKDKWRLVRANVANGSLVNAGDLLFIIKQEKE